MPTFLLDLRPIQSTHPLNRLSLLAAIGPLAYLCPTIAEPPLQLQAWQHYPLDEVSCRYPLNHFKLASDIGRLPWAKYEP